MAGNEWWQRSMELYMGRKKRDPTKLRADMQKAVNEHGEEINEFQKEFQKGVEKYRRRMKK